MKIVYFGSDVFYSCFAYFLREHQILALYTYHNEEDYFKEFAIVKKARQLGIPVHYASISSERIARYFTEEGCDLVFVAEYNRILPIPENLPQFRGINTHSSLLPQGRSYYPIEAAMERGLTRSGVTMHKLAPRMDRGDILAQREIAITAGMDSIDVYLQCAAHAREMIAEIAEDLEGHWQSSRPQKEQLPYWQRPESSLLTVHHEMNRQAALEVFRRYNSMTQVFLEGQWYYVTALSDGLSPLEEDVRFLSARHLLYRVIDGHLRLQIHPTEEET